MKKTNTNKTKKFLSIALLLSAATSQVAFCMQQENGVEIKDTTPLSSSNIFFDIASDNLPEVEKIIKEEIIDINNAPKNGIFEGWTPLCWACFKASPAMIKLLLENDAYKSINNPVESGDEKGKTPLYFACKIMHPDVIDLLLKYDANIDEKSLAISLENCFPSHFEDYIYETRQIKYGKIIDQRMIENANGSNCAKQIITCFNNYNKKQKENRQKEERNRVEKLIIAQI